MIQQKNFFNSSEQQEVKIQKKEKHRNHPLPNIKNDNKIIYIHPKKKKEITDENIPIIIYIRNFKIIEREKKKTRYSSVFKCNVKSYIFM